VPFVALVSLLLVGGVAGLLMFNTSLQQTSFRLTELQERAEQLSAQEQTLEMRLHELRDPQRVAARAKRLGMVPNETPAFLRLSDGTVLGHPTPATPEDALRITPLPPAKPKALRPKRVILEVRPDRASHHRGDQAGTRDGDAGERGSREGGR
jgi:hypothetical protein